MAEFNGVRRMPGNPGIPGTSVTKRQGFPESPMQSIFALHRHSGNGIDGGFLYGPYFIVDQQDGHTYKIVCNKGTLSTVMVK
ncbi:MAG: hypothetical protein KGL39_14455 [Patescibacteria group bacterium]|nr:hypothetical protein [Patescibacteria group bacterium]